MPARIRLQRRGKKNQAFYHIVVADGRAPRDGKFIEKLGTYNPNTKPADIVLDVDRSVQWLKNGATPSDTARRILSYKGVLLKRHLQIGVEKGAITQEQADVKFNQWLQEKEAKMHQVKSEDDAKKRETAKARMENEKKVNETKAAALAAKRQAAAEAEAARQAAENAEAAPEEAPAENAAEAPAAE